MSKVSRAFKHALRKLGADLTRFQPRSHPVAKKAELVRRLGIDLVLDVGANAGQFGGELRSLGYRGRLISFEPLKSAFASLQSNAQSDSSWETKNFALGSTDEIQTINVSQLNWSSSLLPPTSETLEIHPGVKVTSTESIQVHRLDSIIDDLDAANKRIWMKVDTQGFELEVLKGAERSLAQVQMLQLEMAFVPIYQGQPLFQELHDWVTQRGFTLGSFEGLSWNPRNDELLWLDGLYHRIA